MTGSRTDHRDDDDMTTRPPDSEPIRVFLVVDHTVVRSGLSAYLGTEPSMFVVG
jgi:hypothetical protein